MPEYASLLPFPAAITSRKSTLSGKNFTFANTMLYLSGIAITFFLLLLLLGKKGKTVADIILACWLVVIGVHLLLFYLFISGKIYSYPWVLGIHFPLPLLHGPFLYLYAAALTGRLNLSNKKYLLHFIPALLCWAYLVPFYFLPAEEKVSVFKHKGAGYEVFMAVNIAAIIVSGIVYCVLTMLLHRQHRKNILNQFSYTEKINLDWIQYLTYGIAVIWVFVIFGNDNYVFGTAVFFVLFMGYFGIRQVGIFAPNKSPQITSVINSSAKPPGGINNADKTITVPEETVDEMAVTPAPEISSSAVVNVRDSVKTVKKKYSRSGLTQEAADELHERLNQIIDTEKTFNQSELTLTGLAKKLGTHPNYLSQVINEKEGKNFYDYINTLRTEEFIKVATGPDGQKFTLLSLAFECGFNSKSSFNKYFKKVTGQSPSEYLQKVNIKEVA